MRKQGLADYDYKSDPKGTAVRCSDTASSSHSSLGNKSTIWPSCSSEKDSHSQSIGNIDVCSRCAVPVSMTGSGGANARESAVAAAVAAVRGEEVSLALGGAASNGVSAPLPSSMMKRQRWLWLPVVVVLFWTTTAPVAATEAWLLERRRLAVVFWIGAAMPSSERLCPAGTRRCGGHAGPIVFTWKVHSRMPPVSGLVRSLAGGDTAALAALVAGCSTEKLSIPCEERLLLRENDTNIERARERHTDVRKGESDEENNMIDGCEKQKGDDGRREPTSRLL